MLVPAAAFGPGSESESGGGVVRGPRIDTRNHDDRAIAAATLTRTGRETQAQLEVTVTIQVGPPRFVTSLSVHVAASSCSSDEQSSGAAAAAQESRIATAAA